MNRLTPLLIEIKALQTKHNELNRKEANGFNIFSILRKSGDEVHLHTKFIFELLNPKGSHHQGRLFLDLFLKELSMEFSNPVDAFKERHNMDILLQTSKSAIIIENKIYTQDHSSQLSRYLKTMQKEGYKKTNIHLVYLTLFGEPPSEERVKDRVLSIAYKREITSWLKASIAEVAEISILKETLIQYLRLVQQLTHQSTNKGLLMEIKNLLLQDDNLKNILAIESSIIEAKIEVQFNFWQNLLSNLFPHYAFSFYNTNSDKSLKSSIRRYYQLQKNVKDYGINYQIDDNLSFFVELRKNIYYGFEFLDEELITPQQREAIESLDVEWSEVSNGIYWRYPTKRLNFKDFNHQNIFDLIDDEQRKRDIKKISDEIIGLISNYEKDLLCLKK